MKIDVKFNSNNNTMSPGFSNSTPTAQGTTFYPSVSEDGIISWTNDGGLKNPNPVKIQGPKGDPGESPTVVSCDVISTINNVVTYRIIFSNGATADFEVKNGEDGEPGISPTVVSCEAIDTTDNKTTYRIVFSDGATADFTVKNGQPGIPGTSPTVISCNAISTVDNITTWRITFSDGSIADFSVTNAEESNISEDFIELLEKLEQALFIERPNMSVGNSTVSNPEQTTNATYKAPNASTGSYVTGIGIPMNKNTMFGSADTIHAIRLNRYRIFDREGLAMTEGEFTIGIQIRSYDSTYMAAKSKLKKTYTTTAIFPAEEDCIDLVFEIPRSDFDEFDDDEYFMILFNLVSSDAKYALRHSKNESFYHPLTEKNSSGAYLYLGYTQNGLLNGTVANSYEKYPPDIFFSTELESVPIDISDIIDKDPELNTDHLLQLPETFDLVVDDTLEIYYKGITFALNTDDFDYELSYSDGKNRGNNYTSKYVWTPTSSDVGVYTLSVAIRDNYGRILDEGSVKLNVVPKPVSPASERVYLFIGASTVAPGHYPKEVIRRLTSTSGASIEDNIIWPAGDGLTGIKTIGTIEKDGVRYEGYGGWSASSYTTANALRPYFVYIIGDFSTTIISQHSRYVDNNNQLWQVESITGTKIKLVAIKEDDGNVDTNCKGLNIGSDGKVPASGSLTYANGNPGDATTLTYTATEKAESNPFWNTELGRNDFISYAEKHDVEKIDEAIIILGWNSTTTDSIERENAMRKLVEDILRDFPDCHVTLCGLQGPSRDGFGTNYGISWNYYEKLGAMFDMQAAYMRIANDKKYDGHVSFVHVSGQFDADNNYPVSKVSTNSRNAITVDRENNGLHPTKVGYYQIADAVYRHLVTRL